jgi:hypothetical protein
MVIFHSYLNVYQRVTQDAPNRCSRNNATIAVWRLLDDTPTPNTQEIWQRNASLGCYMASGHTKGLPEMYGNVFPNLNLS